MCLIGIWMNASLKAMVSNAEAQQLVLRSKKTAPAFALSNTYEDISRRCLRCPHSGMHQVLTQLEMLSLTLGINKVLTEK